MTGPTRTVAATHDLPRIRRWINSQVRHAVNEAAHALNAVRSWCDHYEQAAVICQERNNGTACGRCEEAARVAAHFRSLLPDLSPERRAEQGEEDPDGHASDARGRPGAVSPDP